MTLLLPSQRCTPHATDFLPTVAWTPTTGELVAGRFRLVRELERGGMGSVWVADHVGLDMPCAVKFIDIDGEVTEDHRARFRQEARAAAKLRSRFVVQMLDYGVWKGAPYVAGVLTGDAPIPGSGALVQSNNEVGVVARHSATGSGKWGHALGVAAGTTAEARAVAADSGAVFAAGSFTGAPAAFPDTALSAEGDRDGFSFSTGADGITVEPRGFGAPPPAPTSRAGGWRCSAPTASWAASTPVRSPLMGATRLRRGLLWLRRQADPVKRSGAARWARDASEHHLAGTDRRGAYR